MKKRKASKFLAPAVAAGMLFGATGFSANAATDTVESGETLWDIAQEHILNVNELVDLNSNLDPRAIPVGTEVELPGEDTVTHVVQPGNTLWGIAQVYDGVSVDHLYDLNEGVDPYTLTIGSELTVVDYDNSTNNSDVIYHTVQPGNTFYEIASVYDGVSVDDIAEANPTLDPQALIIGSQVAIPLN
ncbi:LysM peptidoglycan-binding domain-containing protein [Litchfieldia alkalitelluris]|uniref:LysM peptidoglycan-binding domain-containing protein n=1 Tax=Litchfieldia alkalitelluris TaxID=304268 RepID=UPI001473BE4A|nr:LysM domain-containing protein [Litchfieldia alkalitelluris]